VTEAVKVELDVPAPAVIAFGDRAMLKVCGELMVRDRGVECDSEPEVPLTIKGKLPVAVGTVRVTVWLVPTGPVMGKAGEVVAPEGKPETASDTEPEKPF
jgi:hypothetical protein